MKISPAFSRILSSLTALFGSLQTGFFDNLNDTEILLKKIKKKKVVFSLENSYSKAYSFSLCLLYVYKTINTWSNNAK